MIAEILSNKPRYTIKSREHVSLISTLPAENGHKLTIHFSGSVGRGI